MVTLTPTIPILSAPASPRCFVLGRGSPAHAQLSPGDDLKGRQLNQLLQLLGVLQVLQVLAILGGRLCGLCGRRGLFFLSHGGAEALESMRKRGEAAGLGQGLAAESQAAVSS